VIDVTVQDTSIAIPSIENDESYSLKIQQSPEGERENSVIQVTLQAETVFGIRHALETLSQLIAYDEQEETLAIASDHVSITDKPAFRYRGVMVDVSRHFISLTKLEETVRALGYNKMNVLHLHLSDTSSIPLTFPSQPEVTSHAVYDEEMMFTVQEMQRLIELAAIYGVMVLPELDAPAHMNAGWQWGPDAGLGDLVLCADAYGTEGNRWSEDAMGPPGGQFNLVNEHAYNILGHLYKDTIAQFSPYSAYFHLGGDEVIVGSDETSKACYNSTQRAQPILEYLQSNGFDRNSEETFYGLWENFTMRATEMVQSEYKQQGHQSLKKLHIWGGGGIDSTGVAYNLMERSNVQTILPPELFTIQVWDRSEDSIVPRLIRDQGYEVVLSNTDYVYLDCGDSGWAFAGGYWCQPYHEWYHIYNYIHDVTNLWSLTEEEKYKKIVGSETLIWTEKTDDLLISQKVWPRSAALAEALWSDPQDGWYAADARMQQWRNKLVKRGIEAEPLQPFWCQQRAGDVCTLNSGTPQ
jgi:hexosaminidase